MSSSLKRPIHLVSPPSDQEADVVLSKPWDRRDFIQHTLMVGMSLVVGCGTNEPVNTALGSPDSGTKPPFTLSENGPNGPAIPAPVQACDDPLASGEWLGNMVFTTDEDIPKNTPMGVGWDGRLYTDLSALDSDSLIVPNRDFYIRTRYPDQLDPNAPWQITVDGLVNEPTTLDMADIYPLVEPMGVHVLECSGNWQGGAFGLLSAAHWSGVPVMKVLDLLDIHRDATRVLIGGFDQHSVPSAGGHSTPGASWVFTFDQLQAQGAFFATKMNGEDLPLDHGFPIRLIVPGWYGCCSIKWVDQIRLVDESEWATSQMQEFASRTHQNGVPMLARDYIPASMDQAAMPIRVEKWRLNNEITYRIVGVMWGGYEPTDSLTIQCGREPWQKVQICQEQTTNATWSLWSYLWKPAERGVYSIAMQVADSSIPTRRLDMGWYERSVRIDEV